MSAPAIWIFIPFLAGAIILFFVNERYSAAAGGSVAVVLSLTALIFPIDTALLLGTISMKISASIQIFGRSFIFSTADGPLLAIITVLPPFGFLEHKLPVYPIDLFLLV